MGVAEHIFCVLLIRLSKVEKMLIPLTLNQGTKITGKILVYVFALNHSSLKQCCGVKLYRKKQNQGNSEKVNDILSEQQGLLFYNFFAKNIALTSLPGY